MMTKSHFFQKLNDSITTVLEEYGSYKMDIAIKTNGSNGVIKSWLNDYALLMNINNQFVEVYVEYNEDNNYYYLTVRENYSPDFYTPKSEDEKYNNEVIEYVTVKADNGDEDFDEDESDPFEEIYEVQENFRMLNEKNVPIKGTFYKTYGGGPEGGYLITKKNIYAIERTWGTPYTIKHAYECSADAVEFIEKNEEKGIHHQIYVPQCYKISK
jgi:hypothetical protein